MNSPASTLDQVGNFVLEEWAMMMVDPVESTDGIFSHDQKLYVVSAHYTGVFDGRLTIVCQTPFLEALAGNLLGLEPGTTAVEAEKLDSLKEFANVISGNFLVNTFGDDTVFELPHFEIVESDISHIGDFLNNKPSYFMGDGAPVAINFEIKVSDYESSKSSGS